MTKFKKGQEVFIHNDDDQFERMTVVEIRKDEEGDQSEIMVEDCKGERHLRPTYSGRVFTDMLEMQNKVIRDWKDRSDAIDRTMDDSKKLTKILGGTFSKLVDINYPCTGRGFLPWW